MPIFGESHLNKVKAYNIVNISRDIADSWGISPQQSKGTSGQGKIHLVDGQRIVQGLVGTFFASWVLHVDIL